MEKEVKEELQKEEVKKTEPKVKLEDANEKVEEVREKLKEKLDDLNEKTKKMKALVTSRILFISALLLMFISLTWGNFAGELSSSYYDYWGRVG